MKTVASVISVQSRKKKPYQEGQSIHPKIFHNGTNRHDHQLSHPSVNYMLIFYIFQYFNIITFSIDL
jgi:hypothetical protein